MTTEERKLLLDLVEAGIRAGERNGCETCSACGGDGGGRDYCGVCRGQGTVRPSADAIVDRVLAAHRRRGR